MVVVVRNLLLEHVDFFLEEVNLLSCLLMQLLLVRCHRGPDVLDDLLGSLGSGLTLLLHAKLGRLRGHLFAFLVVILHDLGRGIQCLFVHARRLSIVGWRVALLHTFFVLLVLVRVQHLGCFRFNRLFGLLVVSCDRLLVGGISLLVFCFFVNAEVLLDVLDAEHLVDLLRGLGCDLVLSFFAGLGVLLEALLEGLASLGLCLGLLCSDLGRRLETLGDVCQGVVFTSFTLTRFLCSST
mmetsp:Transcript_11396/g.13483  ORF Transcript_11396/g.13483 Transcript_11396/m.13483 type:complete len:239 (-) Transcript_11396:186-902(-)